MTDANNNMDKVFRDKLGDFSQQPPEEIWAGIKSGIGKKPRRKILIPLWQAAAGMALIITAGSIFYFLNRPVNNNIALQTPPAKQNTLNILQNKPITGQEEEIFSNSPAETGNTGHTYLKKTENFKSGEFSNDHPDSGENYPGNDFSTGNKNVEVPGSRQNIIEVIFVYSYKPTVAEDKIPRNKNINVANWEMLIADVGLDVDNSMGPKNILLTAQMSPTYSYRDIANSGASEFNQNESGKISYSGGLQIGYKTSDRLSFHAGLMYSQLAYEVNNVNKYYVNLASTGTDVLSTPVETASVYGAKNSIGTISAPDRGSIFVAENNSVKGEKDYYSNVTGGVGSSVQTEGIVNQVFQYIEVPFLLRYKIVDRKFGVNLLGGLSTNILMGNHTSLTLQGETSNIGSSKNIRDINYMGNMGLGFDYTLNKNIIFTMEPQFKYFLNSINQNNLITNRPYMMGIFTGVRLVW